MTSSAAKRLEALSEAQRKAPQIQGCVGVDLGYRYKENVRTRQITIRFHFPAKFPVSDLSTDQMVPKEIGGEATDVVVASYDLHAGSPRGEVTPLQPGISIGNVDHDETGTLGMFVDDKLDGGVCLLSNWHILCGSRSKAR